MSINTTTQTFTPKNTIGVLRQRTNKFLELRKRIAEENSFSKHETGSILNDNGKTR